MALSQVARHRARYLIPIGAAAVTAVVVLAPQAASGAQHPSLPPRTAGQLLAALERSQLPEFSGTTVETARLGLPSLSESDLPAGVSVGAQSQLMQIVTLLTGSHTAQVAYGGPERQRVAVFLSDLSETDVVHNGTDLWTYSSDGNSVTHNTLKPQAQQQEPAGTTEVDPTRAAQQTLAAIDPSTKVTVDRTAEVAGRPAYQLDLDPRDTRTLISSVRLAVDAKTWMPLRVEVWSRTNTKSPAFSVGFTSLSLKAPSASTFDFTKPPSATMSSSPFSGLHSATNDRGSSDTTSTHEIGKGWTSVIVERLNGAEAAPAFGPQVQTVRPSSATAQPSTRAKLPTTTTSPRQSGSGLGQTLDELATRVPEGHLITTSLVSVLLTDDNRVLVGAVTPAYLEQLAASKAAQ